jgi:hypothetical protein
MLPVIDLEASGLKKNTYPIEVGIYIPTNDGAIEESWLIKPEQDWLDNREWNEDAAKIHNIPMHELKRDGIPGFEVCNRLNSILSGTTIYSDAPEYDEHWLSVMFDYWGISMHFDIEHILWPNNLKYRKKLQNVNFEDFRNLKIKYSKKHSLIEHRALGDAKAIGLAINHCLKKK